MPPVTFQALNQSMTAHPAYDGYAAKLVELKNSHGMIIILMDIGATWLSCQIPLKAGRREVLLGVDTMEKYRSQGSYLGTTIGRYANRIAKGRFSLEGQLYQVSTNPSGHCLHGGEDGFDKRRWAISKQTENSVCFTLYSADGDQGFPGNVKASVSYQVTEDNQVQIDYSAHTDKPCPINLTNHAYFNLLGADSIGHSSNELDNSILSHILSINSELYLPITADGIPLNCPESVDNTSFDFRLPKVIAQDFNIDQQQQQVNGYDHAYVVNLNEGKVSCVASVTSPDSLITMKVLTNKPALQFYSGNFLAGTPSRSSTAYANYSGFALETQFLPDSPNHPEWQYGQPIAAILQPQQPYQYCTSYQFEF